MAPSYRNPDDAVVLGERLRRTRKNSGMTLKELNTATGVSHSQISRIERGQFKGESKNVQILCEFLNIAVDQNSRLSEPRHLALRLERLALSSPKWMNVVAAFAEALEDAQNSLPPGG